MLKFKKNETPINRVNTGTRQSIDDTICIGQFLRNGGNRIFKIVSLTDKQIELESINGERKQTLTMGRFAFVCLYYMKNYSQIPNPQSLFREIENAQCIGANRLLIKPEKFQF